MKDFFVIVQDFFVKVQIFVCRSTRLFWNSTNADKKRSYFYPQYETVSKKFKIF